MGKKRELCIKLFLSTFRLSACTFGGGFVIIPLMRRRFVEQLHWLEEQEMLDMIAIAQSSPGAIAVNAAILVGYRVAGIVGALVAMLGTVLPPLIIITIISFFYTWFRNNPIVNMAMGGMLAGVAAVILDVVYTMGRDVVKKKQLLQIVIMVAAFVAVYFLHVNIILIIAVCGVLGAIQTLRLTKKEAGQ